MRAVKVDTGFTPSPKRVAYFHEHVDKRGPDECWPWTGGTAPNGYGQLYWDGRPRGAHYVAYALAYGEPPPKRINGQRADLDHTCHPPTCLLKVECPHHRCCNPAHLEPKTASANRKRGDVTRPGNGGGKKCEPGCTCARHLGHGGGQKPCPPGCTCFKHAPRASRKCPPGCTCGHHRLRKPCCPKCGGPYTMREDGSRVCRPCQRASAHDRWMRIRRPRGGPGVHQREQTECIHGHEFTPENTYIAPDGGRVCKECRRERKRKARLNSPGGGKPCPPGCTCGRHRAA